MSDENLYTNADPEYRATRTVSGIPPPSLRSLPVDNQPQSYRSAHNGPTQHRSVRDDHVVPNSRPPPRELDLLGDRDFLKCDSDHRLAIDDLLATIRVKPLQESDSFWCDKSLIDQLNAMRKRVKDASDEARAKSNRYASINKSIFMNRAATKIAALDATFGLTSSKDNKPFIFADICGGPGGFAEYLLWRVHGWGGTAQGYGITLKSNDNAVNWRTEKLGSSDFIVVNGPDGTGNIYNEANIRAFGETIQERTKGQGVDLAVADGGFDFTGHEHHQEHQTRRLRLCEIITMLTCLKQGGTFVCKFFDITEDFSANLVWLLHQLFDQICITKPLSSRPANSERYIVCKGLRTQFPENLIKALLSVSDALQTHPAQVGSFVPRAVLEDDEAFVKYIHMKNIKFSNRQLDALKDLNRCMDYPDRPPLFDQERYRSYCLKAWYLPLDRPSSNIQ